MWTMGIHAKALHSPQNTYAGEQFLVGGGLSGSFGFAPADLTVELGYMEAPADGSPSATYANVGLRFFPGATENPEAAVSWYVRGSTGVRYASWKEPGPRFRSGLGATGALGVVFFRHADYNLAVEAGYDTQFFPVGAGSAAHGFQASATFTTSTLGFFSGIGQCVVFALDTGCATATCP